MGPSLDNLPVELYLAIISHFHDDGCQQSLLSLSRAIPRSPVPTHILFEKIRLRHSGQIFQLYLRLRHAPEDASRVRRISLESWTVDADKFVNLMALLPAMERLSLNIGTNFAPEHMEEIFHGPKQGLQFISMRFRPYVQRATYYPFLKYPECLVKHVPEPSGVRHFRAYFPESLALGLGVTCHDIPHGKSRRLKFDLKGAYFDSTLVALARWPSQTLPTLSIVQDPFDPVFAPTNFAQPIVFFHLAPLSILAVSPLCYHLKHFRLRIPSRQLCRYLHVQPNSFPSLEFLDMSTSNVSPQDLEGLLGRLSGIHTLVLDGCPIVSQRTDVQVDAGEPFLQWMELGQTLALAGVRRATEREKKLKAWVEEYYANAPDEAAAQAAGPLKKPRKGRKGLATAAFSLRAPSPERKVREDVTISRDRIPRRNQRVRILPPPPALRSFATSFPGELTPQTHEAVKTEFERGWAAGIARLASIRLRLQTSYRNGVARVVRFADNGTSEWEEEDKHGEQGLAGLVDVHEESAFVLNVDDDGEAGTSARRAHACPLLCLAGSGRDSAHVQGCGHRTGWNIFGDEI